jgi:radical SAM protein with 4Fe4S-binding SPASM domain
MDWRSPCGAGIGQIAYNVDGQVYTCDEGRMVGNDNFKIGRVESDLNFLLTSDVCISTLNSSMTEQLFCDYCAYRPFCGICPVLNYSEHGHDYLGAVGGAICRARMGMIAYVLHLYEKSEHYRNLLGRIYENAMLDRATQRQNTK